MRLATPLELGGDRYLEAVSVGRDPDSGTVRDCPGCSGHCYDDEWHLKATVLDRAAGSGCSRPPDAPLPDEQPVVLPGVFQKPVGRLEGLPTATPVRGRRRILSCRHTSVYDGVL